METLSISLIPFDRVRLTKMKKTHNLYICCVVLFQNGVFFSLPDLKELTI